MTKYIAGLLNAIILLFDWIGFRDQQAIIHWFMTISRQQLLIHLGVSIGLLLYALFPQIRYRFTQIPLFLTGLLLLVAGFVGITSPNFFGYRADIILVIDIFFCIESGIVLMLAALELPIRHLRQPNKNLYATKDAIGNTSARALTN
jgi:hypothetical protein